jgi:hypothetical protein
MGTNTAAIRAPYRETPPEPSERIRRAEEQCEQDLVLFRREAVRTFRRAIEHDTPDIREWLCELATDAENAGLDAMARQIDEILTASDGRERREA